MLDEEQLSKLKKDINLTIYCDKCNIIPLLVILPQNPPKVKIICKCSTRIITIDDYIAELNRMNSVKAFCEYNTKHSIIESHCYCKKCNKYLCKKCTLLHQTTDKSHFLYKRKIGIPLESKRHEEFHVKAFSFCFECFINFCPCCGDNHYNHYAINTLQVV